MHCVFKKVSYSNHCCLISVCLLVEMSPHWHPGFIPYTKEVTLTQMALPGTRALPPAVTSRDMQDHLDLKILWEGLVPQIQNGRWYM